MVGVDTEAKTGHQLDRQVESGRRFISQDPAGFAGGSTNLYQYATGDPVNLSDPNGDCPICIAMVAQCAIGGLISLAIGWGSAALEGRKYSVGNGLTDFAVGCVTAALFEFGGAALGGLLRGAAISEQLAGGAVENGGLLARIKAFNWQDDTGAISIGSRYTDDQDALIQLAKQAKRRGGVSMDEANTLADWADELGLPGHGPAIHPGRPGFGGTTIHINIGPIKHIRVIP